MFANATALEWLNLQAVPVSGKSIRDVLSPTLYAHLQSAIERVLKGENWISSNAVKAASTNSITVVIARTLMSRGA